MSFLLGTRGLPVSNNDPFSSQKVWIAGAVFLPSRSPVSKWPTDMPHARHVDQCPFHYRNRCFTVRVGGLSSAP